MRSSLLERMSAPLCDALLGNREGRRTLETLERKNLFVFALDDRRTWYRYHPLFSGFLRERLRTELPGEEETLHERAAAWCEREGLHAEAVRYALSGRRFAHAARLLETSGRELFRRGDFLELHRWIDRLPPEEVRRSVTLSALDGWALGYLGEFREARRRMAWADEAVGRAEGEGGDGTPLSPARAELSILKAVLGIIQKDEPDVTGLDPSVTAAFSPGETTLRGYASVALGFARRREGDLPAALARFREGVEITDGTDDPLVNLNARLNVGIVLWLMGREGEAERSFRDSLEAARTRRWQRGIGAAFLRYGLALVLHDRIRPEEALVELSEAIASLERGGAYGFLGMAIVEKARVLYSLGNREEAAADLAEARRVAREHDVERVSLRAALLEARMAIREGRLARAAECLREAGDLPGGEGGGPAYPEKREIFLLERIRLMVARHESSEAARLSAQAAKDAAAAGRARHAVEFQVLQAAALLSMERKEKALGVFEGALSAASGEGILRPFVDAGRQILPLLRHFEYAQVLHVPVHSILWALNERGGGGKRGPRGEGGDRLHIREVQILELIGQGLRNREVAKRLSLTDETVKWYLKRLFSKLSVRTRAEAIVKARRMGLIS
jgi:LuxR family maltose regulon positive regulatory protein